jgi:hypothetical protein
MIPDIGQTICPLSRRKTLDGIFLHLDHAPVHNSRLSSEKIESAKVERVLHQPYSPDLALSDFFLFDYLKEQLRGRRPLRATI